MITAAALGFVFGGGGKILAAVLAMATLAVGVLTARGSIGDNNSAVHLSDNASLTAGGTGDATEVVGQIIDRATYGYSQSIAILVGCKAALSANKALQIAWHLEHSDASDMSGATDYVNVAAANVLASVGGGTVRGVFGNDVDLGGAKRYLRLKYTPDLTASGTDTAECSASGLFAQV